MIDGSRDVPTSASQAPAEPPIAEPTEAVGHRVGRPFAHASEAEMARILDFYAVRWEYEPVTFPILWNLEGEVVESFSPDFYLPDLDLFLEMTTLRQRLVRKKNRKLRRLRELYPDVRIKLFYARDFRAMMLKYGRFALVESLSGSIGQVVPDRATPLPADVALPEPAGSAGAVGTPASAGDPTPTTAGVVLAVTSGLAIDAGTRRGGGHAKTTRRERRATGSADRPLA